MPAEFVSVTETLPSAAVSPVKLNGIVSENDPPAVTPGVFVATNHVFEAVVKGTVRFAPLSVAPDAAEKVTFALKRSRGVDVPSSTTWKPDDVMLVILTEPGTIVGGSRGTVIVAVGAVGSCNAPPEVSDKLDSRTVITPATVPN